MAVQMTVTLISTRFPGTSIHLAGYIAFDRIRSAAAQTRRAKMPFTISPLSSVPVTTPLNGSQFHELLQPLHGVNHHSVDSGDRWPGGRPLCPQLLSVAALTLRYFAASTSRMYRCSPFA